MKYLVTDINGGDKETLEAFHIYCRRLAVHILNCQFMTDLEKIAVGGDISVQPQLLGTKWRFTRCYHKRSPHRK